MPTKRAIQREQDKQRKHRLNVLLIVAGIVVALIVGAGQIWYAHRNALSNRPNVGVHVSIPRKFSAGEKVILAVEVKNFGNAEAFNLTAHSTLIVGTFKTDQDAFDTAPLAIADEPDTHTVLPPGDSLQQTLVSPKPFTGEDFQFIMNSTSKIYFFFEDFLRGFIGQQIWPRGMRVFFFRCSSNVPL